MTATDIQTFTLTNASGASLTTSNFGAIVQSILVPDRSGVLADVTLGFDKIEDYRHNPAYFGCLVGRYANRISGGKFTLDGKEYMLDENHVFGDMKCHLHGGKVGFNQAVWQVEEVTGHSVTYSHISPSGDQGYPGELKVTCRYEWDDDCTFGMDVRAVSTEPTVINLVQHAYFNLSGDLSQQIVDHEIKIYASSFTPVNRTVIPTGEIAPLYGALDLRESVRIGEGIDFDEEQMVLGSGYDHNFVLDGPESGLKQAAEVHDPASGRRLAVWTDQPAVQFYTGNHLDGSLTGKGGIPIAYRTGFCLETQHFPDSPNQPHFPSTELRPSEEFRTRTEYRFGI